MKRLFLFLFLSQTLQIFSQEMHVRDARYNFGFVREGEVVQMEFGFENTGNAPLLISDYKVECGCTVMEKPAEPVMPGKKSVLHVSFDTANKLDRQDRTVTVISNAVNSPVELRFKGVILKKKE